MMIPFAFLFTSNYSALTSRTLWKKPHQYSRCFFKSHRNFFSSSISCNTDNSPAQLVSPPDLKRFIVENGQEELIILDVRGRVVKEGNPTDDGLQRVKYLCDDDAFLSEHIPDSRFVDWRKIDLGNHVAFCDDMAQVGVQRETPICIYDWGDMLFSTRLWLALLAVGCTDVRVLNGGWTAWERIHGPVSLDTICPLKAFSEFRSADEEQRPYISVDFNEMRSIVRDCESSRVLLLDARSQKQFIGEERRCQKAGHIPGATSVPYRLLLNDDGIGLRTDDQLRQIFEKEGASALLDGSASGVAYCNGGVASSLVVFAATRCGVPWESVRNYCGSFNEWGNRTDTPVVKTFPTEN